MGITVALAACFLGHLAAEQAGPLPADGVRNGVMHGCTILLLLGIALVAPRPRPNLTLATDWAAVAARADRASWDGGTPWLIASLLPLTGVTAGSLLFHRRAIRQLPKPVRGAEGAGGDWLDDLAPLADLLADTRSRTGRALAALIGRGDVLGLVRLHFAPLAAAAALAAGLLVATGLASGEGWPGALLFTVESAVFAGGTFAFVMICNSVLRLPRLLPHRERDGPPGSRSPQAR